MKKINDFLTFIGNQEDEKFLQTKLLDVNMRLFKSSDDYRQIVLSCCSYIKSLALSVFEDYKKPHGMSGANAAIPFNIIAVVIGDDAKIMINPIILATSKNSVTSQSNCGSVRLNEPIEVKRNEWIVVSYFDLDGNSFVERFDRKNKGFTIQHEIEHNLGILITDK